MLYAPDLDTNLLSVAKFAEFGVNVLFRGNACFFSGHPPLGRFGYGMRDDNLYHARMTVRQPQFPSAYLTSTQSETHQDLDLWHRRFGHVSEGTVLEMARNNAVSGFSLSRSSISGRCESCIFGKHSASPSPLKASRATQVFDKIHSDILVIGDHSIGGAKYALTFVDEASGYLWVHPVSDKSADTILKHFRDLVTWALNQFGKRVHILHSDNGGEFVNNSMAEYLAEQGITHHTIVPHRHEMNGLAERLNRTLADGVRSMLADSGLSVGYWAEAITYLAQVRNSCGRSFLPPSVTPYELVHGRKPDVSHFRVFGCTAFLKSMDPNRKKLDAKSVKGIFVGLFNDAAYRIMLPNNAVVKSKDVFFDEGKGARTSMSTDSSDSLSS